MKRESTLVINGTLLKLALIRKAAYMYYPVPGKPRKLVESGRSMLLLLPRTHLLLLLHCCDQVQKYTRHHSPQSQGDVVVTAPGSSGLLDPTLGDSGVPSVLEF